MKRWHEEYHRSEREWRKRHRSLVQSNIEFGRGEDPAIDCDKQVGRFRKRKPFDCGKPRCFICHSSKLLGHLSHHDMRANDDFESQLSDFYEDYGNF